MTAEEFGDAYSRAFDSTVRFLLHRGLSYDAALDAAQDGWTRGWQYREQLRDANLLSTWVNSIALNSYRSLLRSRGGDAFAVELPRTLPGQSIDVAAIDARRLMRMIPPPVQRTLRQFYLDGLSIQDLAKAWRCTPTAARIRLLRARQLAKSRVAKNV